ncbi:MAG: alkaline phosphatase family protein [Muribaculaceae bacterium]|nr:alkaline phosphatase family protein [Muribaculaceae bacterium]
MKKQQITSSVAGLLVAAFSIITVTAQTATPQQPRKRPALVVGIVVEGLTMDYLDLLRTHLTEGGFKRLLEQGVTVTDLDFGTPLDGAAASALLFTGAPPAVNGIPAAAIYNPETRRSSSVLLDPETIGNFTDETLSPKNLTASTIADELRIDGGGLGYVYAIAPDAAEAIILAGHTGNSAFWINDATGKWATTTYYKDLPAPAQNLNHREPNEYRLDTLQWVPSVAVDKLPDLPSYKKLYPFRHNFPRTTTTRYKAYKNSPAVNTDITRLAADYVSALSLGKRESTDMLNLGYTLKPFIYAREADTRAETMDAYLRLDRDLARLFSTIEEKGPGMSNTLVFLAGTPLTNRSRRDDEKWGIPFGEFSSRKAVSLLNMYLMAIHGNGEWVSGYHDGQLFLNHKLIKERNKDLRVMRDESARFLTRMSGVTNAWTIDDVLDRRASERPDAMRRNTQVAMAGDIFVSIAPGWQETDDDSDTDIPPTTVRAAASTAPAFILIPGGTPATVATPVDARALAPTVAGLLRIRSPNGASLPRLRW